MCKVFFFKIFNLEITPKQNACYLFNHINSKIKSNRLATQITNTIRLFSVFKKK